MLRLLSTLRAVIYGLLWGIVALTVFIVNSNLGIVFLILLVLNYSILIYLEVKTNEIINKTLLSVSKAHFKANADKDDVTH